MARTPFAASHSSSVSSQDLSQAADRDLEREANVFGAELLMPEAAVREA